MIEFATIYRISEDAFSQMLKNPSAGFDIDAAKNYVSFNGSAMALEFILSKEQTEEATSLISEIFYPEHTIGEQDIDNLTPQEQFDYLESGLHLPYLDKTTIAEISAILNRFSEEDIATRYNAEELNRNEIYPEIWHDDNSPDQAYNLRHIITDFANLKDIFHQAENEQDYLLVFNG